MLATVGPIAPLDVILADAVGCVMAADLVADAPLPRVPVAACDGYAVAAADTTDQGTERAQPIPVAHDVLAGAPEAIRLAPGRAVRIASGAPLPVGADAVFPVSESDRGAAAVRFARPASPQENVVGVGARAVAGEVIITEGTRLSARHIAAAAVMGRGRLRVHPKPRVVILAVGGELLEPGQPYRQGATYEADGHAIEAAVRDAGGVPVRVGIVPDDRAVLRDSLEDQLVRADMIITTGGLSDYANDTVADVLAPLGTVRFDLVAMSPGGRQGFGTLGAARGEAVPIFALPGDPVGAQTAFEVVVRPALRSVGGHTDLHRPSVLATAAVGWASPAGRRQFVPAVVQGSPSEGYTVTPTGDAMRPSARDVAMANAMAVVPEADTFIVPGRPVHCLLLEV